MLRKKLWRTFLLYKAQFLSMILMIAIGIGIFVGFNMEWVSIEENTGSFFEETGFADYRLISEEGFSGEEQEKIRDSAGIDAAARYAVFDVDVAGFGDDALSLSVTEDASVSGFLVLAGEAYDDESDDGIWLSDRYAAANDIAVGDTLTLDYQRLRFSGEVKGLVKAGEHLICVRDETQLMPDYDTFGFAYISPAFYERAAGVPFYPQIHIRSALTKNQITDLADDVLGRTVMVLTKDEVLSYAEAKGEAKEGKAMGSILPVLFLLIAVLTMVTTMHRLTAKEKPQIGTMKALGLKDRRITRHYTSYAFLIGLLGVGAGLGLGYYIAWYIMHPEGSMGTYLDMPDWTLRLPLFCVVILAAAEIALTLIGYGSVRRMLAGNAADALRPYAPKKMKPLRAEKTKLWRRLGFGARWNLRDVSRHKSRTLMSLFGVVGCTMIIIAALGMSDTMDAFLDLYYDKATLYDTRINLADDADGAAAEAIAGSYGGDTSAAVSARLEDKAVSLEIYDTPGNLVRFPDEDDHFQPLGDDGAYVCLRLSRAFDLSPGDTFTLRPYGGDDVYTLKVAGLIRSVSENIVITPAYAEKLGLSYDIHSVYTALAKEEIRDDSAIASVQSKQTIIDSFDTFIDIMNVMVYILIAAAVVLGVVVLYNLGVMSYTERYREMATLKVVGFKDKKIGRLLIGQNMWISFLGLVLGIPLGVYVLGVLLDALAGEYEMKLAVTAQTCFLTAGLIVGMSLLVSVLVARKNRKIDMVEALKAGE